MSPKISYLVSTYDSGHYLDRHIHNLINRQDDPEFEIIIVNPNSPGTDDAIARKWEATDPRVRYIYYEQREWYGASWLRGWKAASAPLVCNSNTDDLHYPGFTRIMSEAFDDAMLTSLGKMGFAYAGIHVVDVDGRTIAGGVKPPFDREVMSRECWGGPQVVWRNDPEFLDSLNWNLMEVRANEYRSAFDYWLWLYFMSLGYDGLSVPEILTIYTQRSDSIENSNKHENNWETYSSIAEFFPHNFLNHLKHAKEFSDFDSRPEREEWVTHMQQNKHWKRRKK
jgi:glycosyltransferase involved in cell wall biosynthesis